MKITFAKTNCAMTLLEVLVVMLVVVFLVTVFVLPTLHPGPQRAPRIQCVNNLKQIGLATRVWEGDNNDRYPPQVPGTNGGSMDFMTGPNVWRTFQVMSNELSTPKVVICPADEQRSFATNFTDFNNSNVSFFYGVDATETNPAMFLTGDRNITNGVRIRNGVLTLTTNEPAGWTSDLHNKIGNICLADGSVQQLSIAGLQTSVANTGVETNRVQMPILVP